MSAARIVAVTALMLDVMSDLADTDMDQMGPAEADLAFLLIPHLHDLKMINALAVKEMNALAPRVLAEANPAPG